MSSPYVIPGTPTKKSGPEPQENKLTETEISNIDTTFDVVSEHFKIPVHKFYFKGNTKNERPEKSKKTLTELRYIAWVGCIFIFGIKKQNQVAKFTGQYNHATLTYGLRKIAGWIEFPYTEKEFKKVLEKIINKYNKLTNNNLTYTTWKKSFLSHIKSTSRPSRQN